MQLWRAIKRARRYLGDVVSGKVISNQERQIDEIYEDIRLGLITFPPEIENKREYGILEKHGLLPFEEAKDIVNSSYHDPRGKLLGMMVWSDDAGIRMTCMCLLEDGECPVTTTGADGSLTSFAEWLQKSCGCYLKGRRVVENPGSNKDAGYREYSIYGFPYASK